MQDKIVAIQNLSKTYGGRSVVKGLNVDIGRGEFFGLLGPNGAGKTTTMGMVTGLIAPSEGTILIDSLDVAVHSLEVKAKIGFVPQDFAFYPTLSARDNLLFFGRIYGLHGRPLKQQMDKALRAVDLQDKADDTVSTFSNGMKRRLNIAIAMLHNPHILILDEPTVGVDTHVKQVILENLEILNQGGVTIVLSTHHLEEAQRLCHRVAVMNKGAMVALDTPSALMKNLGQGLVRVCFGRQIPTRLMRAMAAWGELVPLDDDIVHILLGTVRVDEIIRLVRSSAQTAGIPIKRLSILEPSLEAVFLHLTGGSPPSSGQ